MGLHRQATTTKTAAGLIQRYGSIVVPILFVMVGIILGFIWGRFGHKAFLPTFSTHWDVADILTLLLTLAVALFVQIEFVRRGEVRRGQHGFVIDLAERFRVEFARLHNLQREDVRDVRPYSEAIHAVNNSLTDVIDAIEGCEANRHPADLEKAWKHYREVLNVGNPWDLTAAENLELGRTAQAIRKGIGSFILSLHE